METGYIKDILRIAVYGFAGIGFLYFTQLIGWVGYISPADSYGLPQTQLHSKK